MICSGGFADDAAGRGAGARTIQHPDRPARRTRRHRPCDSGRRGDSRRFPVGADRLAGRREVARDPGPGPGPGPGHRPREAEGERVAGGGTGAARGALRCGARLPGADEVGGAGAGVRGEAGARFFDLAPAREDRPAVLFGVVGSGGRFAARSCRPQEPPAGRSAGHQGSGGGVSAAVAAVPGAGRDGRGGRRGHRSPS